MSGRQAAAHDFLGQDTEANADLAGLPLHHSRHHLEHLRPLTTPGPPFPMLPWPRSQTTPPQHPALYPPQYRGSMHHGLDRFYNDCHDIPQPSYGFPTRNQDNFDSSKTKGSVANKKQVRWTVEESSLLTELVKQHGENNWSLVARNLGQKTARQCRVRWINNRPDLKKEQLSTGEVEMLIAAHREYGNKWTKIAKHIPGRPENDIKNYWYSTKRRMKSRKSNRKRDVENPIYRLEDYINSLPTPPPFTLVTEPLTASTLYMDKAITYSDLVLLENSPAIDDMIDEMLLRDLLMSENAPGFADTVDEISVI